ncbi:hypothetical protein ACL03H_16660 [Saccharopolyspora sp. MS10]|uniref:hypothetical protein n=1 Tax=Saccharopolyspora sp. MS10 TaxID=3385973 RepID=UPI00399FC612
MLLVVLFLVLAAGGVLVTSVLIDRPEWSWLSVLLSVLAAALLVVERFRRRREASSSSPGSSPEGEAGREPGEAADDEADDREPDEEDTDAADALLVSDSEDEVVVVDERPRYHLAGCGWLGERAVEGLPVREARELGFTACARCAPDAVLAEKARAVR